MNVLIARNSMSPLNVVTFKQEIVGYGPPSESAQASAKYSP